jgi:hypothetical protein
MFPKQEPDSMDREIARQLLNEGAECCSCGDPDCAITQLIAAERQRRREGPKSQPMISSQEIGMIVKESVKAALKEDRESSLSYRIPRTIGKIFRPIAQFFEKLFWSLIVTILSPILFYVGATNWQFGKKYLATETRILAAEAKIKAALAHDPELEWMATSFDHKEVPGPIKWGWKFGEYLNGISCRFANWRKKRIEAIRLRFKKS